MGSTQESRLKACLKTYKFSVLFDYAEVHLSLNLVWKHSKNTILVPKMYTILVIKYLCSLSNLSEMDRRD